MPYVPQMLLETLDHDGDLVSTHTPVAGSLEWTYQMFEPGPLTCSVALSDAEMSRDVFAPYRSDAQLVMVDDSFGAEPVWAGIMTPNNANSGRKSWHQVRVTALDWLHYLEQAVPFSYELSLADHLDSANENLYRVWKALDGDTQEDVIQDLVDLVSALDGAVQLAPLFEGAGWAETINKLIWFGDQRDVIDHVRDLARLGDPLGFDMFVEVDKTLRLISPRNADPDVITPLYTLDSSTVIVPPIDWSNMGPLATDTVVMGNAGTNTPPFSFKTYQPSRDLYRQWTKVRRAEADDASITYAADARGYQDRFPHKTLDLTIRPDLLDEADPLQGFRNMLGSAITVTQDIVAAMGAYHLIDAPFWIIGQHFRANGKGAYLCRLRLDQVYGTAASPEP